MNPNPKTLALAVLLLTSSAALAEAAPADPALAQPSDMRLVGSVGYAAGMNVTRDEFGAQNWPSLGVTGVYLRGGLQWRDWVGISVEGSASGADFIVGGLGYVRGALTLDVDPTDWLSLGVGPVGVADSEWDGFFSNANPAGSYTGWTARVDAHFRPGQRFARTASGDRRSLVVTFALDAAKVLPDPTVPRLQPATPSLQPMGGYLLVGYSWN